MHRRLFLSILLALWAGTAHAACTGPSGNERDLIYNNDYHTYQFCNGTNWMRVGPISTVTPTAANGYFVLTSSAWNGNLGGYLGANGKCLTELTTNTSWKGYATANANNQLTSPKVHAFICGSSGGYTQYGDGYCNDLKPNVTYLFAYTGDSSKGGASFTTDSQGAGPNDNANWSDAAHFGISTSYWNDRYTGADDTLWALQVWTSGAHCNGWTSSSSGDDGDAPITDDASSGRWNLVYGTDTCNNAHRLICYVDP